MIRHQYIDRETGIPKDEQLFGDRRVRFLYNTVRESAPAMFRALTSRRMSSLLGWWQYDLRLTRRGNGMTLLTRMGIDWSECVEQPAYFDSPRKVFERRIRYWQVRPLEPDPRMVAAPADSRVLIGSFAQTPDLFVKHKFFSVPELLGTAGPWSARFAEGDFAIFRLTPEKYHFNHVPVTGRVADYYPLDGSFHSCNPGALLAEASAHAKNRREVTILDTDIPGGANIGVVAMVEVVALMIGEIEQGYCRQQYQDPQPMIPGMILEKGCPKSLFRPGSSTVILLFEPSRIRFSPDLRRNLYRTDAASRYSAMLDRALVETEVRVRSTVAAARCWCEGRP